LASRRNGDHKLSGRRRAQPAHVTLEYRGCVPGETFAERSTARGCFGEHHRIIGELTVNLGRSDFSTTAAHRRCLLAGPTNNCHRAHSTFEFLQHAAVPGGQGIAGRVRRRGRVQPPCRRFAVFESPGNKWIKMVPAANKTRARPIGAAMFLVVSDFRSTAMIPVDQRVSGARRGRSG